MTETPPPKRTTGAIQKAVQVRRTQEIALQAEQRRQNERLSEEEKKALEEARNNASKPPPSPAARSTAVHNAVSTNTVPVVQPAKRSSLTDAVLERTGWTRPQLQIALIATLAIVLLCGAGSIVALFAIPTPTEAPRPTLTELPIPAIVVTTLPNQFAEKLKYKVENLQTLVVPSANWQATEGIRFDLINGKEHGSFLLLTYANADTAAQDGFRANLSETWKKWKRRQYQTMLLIAAPDTTDTMLAAVDNLIFTNYILPYRSWILTPPPPTVPKK